MMHRIDLVEQNRALRVHLREAVVKLGQLLGDDAHIRVEPRFVFAFVGLELVDFNLKPHQRLLDGPQLYRIIRKGHSGRRALWWLGLCWLILRQWCLVARSAAFR